MVFNPQEQTQDPDWTNKSRVTEAPSANQSTKIGLETLGEGLTGGLSVIDTSVKRGIADTVEKGVDAMRDKFTQGLEGVKSTLDQGLIPQAVAAIGGSTTGKTILDSSSDEPELPAGLESGLSKMQQIAYAKQAGSTKINDTDYARDTLSLAKQLRAQFPGWRDYIDSEVSKASGLPVANSYYQNLMLDINRQMAQLGKTKDDVGTQMIWGMHEGVPNMATYMNMRSNKDPKYPGDAAMLGKINDFTTMKATLQIQAQQRAESKDTKSDQVTKETENLTANTNNLIAHHIQDNLVLSGMPSLRDLINYFDDAAAGRRQANDAEVQQRAQQLQVYRNYLYSEAKKQSIGPDAIIGGETAEKVIANAMTPIDTYIKFANDKESGPAYFHLHQNTAIVEDEKHNNWLVSKDRGALARQLLGARFALGEQYFPDYLKSILVNGQDKPIKDLFSQEALSAVQPLADVRGQPIERTLTDAIKHGKDVGVIDPEYYGKMTAWAAHIADPNMPMDAKDAMIRWAFKPKNLNLMDEFNQDYKDPQGNVVPGKYHALDVLTAPSISKAIAETSQAHPENYKMYRGTTESWFGKLYRSDIDTLNKVVNGQTIPVDSSGRPVSGTVSTDTKVTNKSVQDMHFSFDDTNNQFGIVDKNNRPISMKTLSFKDPEYAAKLSTLETLGRVNRVLANMTQVQLNDPTTQGHQDVPKYLLQLLQTSGFRPGEIIPGATKGMMTAIIKSQKPDLTLKDVDKLLGIGQ